MDHSNINRAALWAFLAVLPLGLACYVAVLIGTRFVKPAKRYVVRLVAMVFVTLLWYAYFLPGFVTVHGGPAWTGGGLRTVALWSSLRRPFHLGMGSGGSGQQAEGNHECTINRLTRALHWTPGRRAVCILKLTGRAQ